MGNLQRILLPYVLMAGSLTAAQTKNNNLPPVETLDSRLTAQAKDDNPPPTQTFNNGSCQAYLQNATYYWGRPLDYYEYYERDWNWLRCRSRHALLFDAGGGWVGDWGANIHGAFRGKPALVTWKYVNGEGWGDVTFQLEAAIAPLYEAMLHSVAPALIRMGAHVARRNGRRLHVWDCPVPTGYPYIGSERVGKVWPRPGEGGGPPIDENPYYGPPEGSEG